MFPIFGETVAILPCHSLYGFARFLVDYQIKNYLYENFRKDYTKNFNTKNFVIA